MIDWDKGHFTGRRALLAEREQGADGRWSGLTCPATCPPKDRCSITPRSTRSGHITAAAWSPSTKRSLAIAQVQASYHKGDNLWVEIYALRELQYVKLMLQVYRGGPPVLRPPPPTRHATREVLMSRPSPPQIAPAGPLPRRPAARRPISIRTGMRAKRRRSGRGTGSMPGGWPTWPPAPCAG